MVEKQILRDKYLKLRKEIVDKYRALARRKVLDLILSLPEYAKANTICSYASFKGELYTTAINQKILDDKKTLALPKMIENKLEFYKIVDLNSLNIEGSFGIREPRTSEENLVNNGEIDIILIPGICFDEQKNRLGFGKGYYDKYLATLPETTLKIGICYDLQVIDNLPIEPYDIKMDMIITEKRIIE